MKNDVKRVKKAAEGPVTVRRMGLGWCVFIGVMPCGGWLNKREADGQARLMNRAMEIWASEPSGKRWMEENVVGGKG